MTDRELDILIGEKIFNLKVDKSLTYSVTCHPQQFGDNCPSCGYDASWNGSDLPNYSTNMEHAWMVVEKMTENRSRNFDLLKDGDGDWFAKFDPLGQEREWLKSDATDVESWVGADGHSASRAICEAALKTVGVKV